MVIPRLTITGAIHILYKIVPPFRFCKCVFQLESSSRLGTFLFQFILSEWNDKFQICSFTAHVKERREKAATWTDGAGRCSEMPWNMQLSLLGDHSSASNKGERCPFLKRDQSSGGRDYLARYNSFFLLRV